MTYLNFLRLEANYNKNEKELINRFEVPDLIKTEVL